MKDIVAIEPERTFFLGGHALRVTRSAEGGRVYLYAPSGDENLCIDITPAGAQLRLQHGLSIAIAGALSFEADSVSLHGRRELRLSSDADAALSAAGHLALRSESSSVTATHGDVAVEANDDVVLLGERIRVNC